MNPTRYDVNGIHVDAVDRVDDNWRDQAINAALQCGAEGGDKADALLKAIRTAMPVRATARLGQDRRQVLRFLQANTVDLRSLMTGSDGFSLGTLLREILPYVGWYGFTWEGSPMEVALAPIAHPGGIVIWIAEDESTLQRFARHVIDYADRPIGRCLRYSTGEGWLSALDMDAEIGDVTWDDIVLPAGVIGRLREAVEGFFRNREAYRALGFSWRRGVLLVGPPGTGKTMVCKAVAAALPHLPFLYVQDMPSSHQAAAAIKVIFERARRIAPCILAFEDVDGLVNDNNRTVFLNELDGFRKNEGLLIIASSNNPGKIDEALLKRPSRFDRVFHLGLPALDERRAYARRVLSGSALADKLAAGFDTEALAEQVAINTDGFTPAYLKEAFISAALNRAQEGATVLDEEFAQAVMTQIEELRQHLRQMRDPSALAEMRTGEAPIGLRP